MSKISRKLRYFNISCAVLVLCACTPLRDVVELKKEPYENVVIIRDDSFYASGYHFWPSVNGKDVAGLLTKQFVSFDVPQGKVKLGVHCFSSHWLWFKWYFDEISVNVPDRATSYFLIKPAFFDCASIESLDEQEAKTYLEHSREIKTGAISDCKGNSVKNGEIVASFCWPWNR